MRLVLTALIVLAGMLNLFQAVGFLIDPGSAATPFGLSAQGSPGLSTLRADFTAFFGLAGGLMILGAWRRNATLLLVPAALFAIAFTGRAITVVVDGAEPGFWFFMAFEAGYVILLLAAWRLLPHRPIAEIAG